MSWIERPNGYLKWEGGGGPKPPPPQYSQHRNLKTLAIPVMKKCKKRKAERIRDPKCNCTSLSITCTKLDKKVVVKDCAFCTINVP